MIRALLLILVVASPSLARADDPAQKGIDLYADARYREAIETLTRAATGVDQPKELARIQLHVGFAHALLGEEGPARAALLLALEQDPDLEADPRRFKPALRALLARVRAGTGLLRVEASGAPKTRILVDGKDLGPPPCRRRLPAGEYRVVARGGALEQVRTVRLAARGESSVVFSVAAQAGNATSPTPAPPTVKQPEPPSFWGRRRVWTWIAAGGAVAAGAAGLGVYLSARSRHDEFIDKRDSAPVAELEDLRDDISTRLTVSGVLTGVAGAAAVTAVVLLLVEGRSPEHREAADRGARWTVGPTGIGLSLPLP